jgi:hypothetical protein
MNKIVKKICLLTLSVAFIYACNKQDESINLKGGQNQNIEKKQGNVKPINKTAESLFIIVDTIDYIETEAELESALQLLSNNQGLSFNNNEEHVYIIENEDGSSPSDNNDGEITVICSYTNSTQKANCLNSAMLAAMYNVGQGGCPIVTGGDGIIIVIDHPCF